MGARRKKRGEVGWGLGGGAGALGGGARGVARGGDLSLQVLMAGPCSPLEGAWEFGLHAMAMENVCGSKAIRLGPPAERLEYGYPRFRSRF